VSTPIRFWTALVAALSTLAIPALAGPPNTPARPSSPPTPRHRRLTTDDRIRRLPKARPPSSTVTFIPMNDVVLLSLRDSRSYLVDQLIQNYVVDRDCQRRGIKVSDAEIDAGVERLRNPSRPPPSRTPLSCIT